MHNTTENMATDVRPASLSNSLSEKLEAEERRVHLLQHDRYLASQLHTYADRINRQAGEYGYPRDYEDVVAEVRRVADRIERSVAQAVNDRRL